MLRLPLALGCLLCLLACPSEPPPPASGGTESGSDTSASGATDGTSGGDFECLSFAEGNVDITGDARVDLVFEAARALLDAYAPTETSIQASLNTLADAWGYGPGGNFDTESVSELMAHIEADIVASATAFGIQVPSPTCSSDVDLALQQQGACQAALGCAAQAPTSVQCQGQCRGDCAGFCEVVACDGPVACDGECRGACDLEVGGGCEGFCQGECGGSCPIDDVGACNGPCDGLCTGVCHLLEGGGCEGICEGTCTADSGSGSCTDANPTCNGGCDAICSGDCLGAPVPVGGNCEVSAHCSIGASALAAVATTCGASPIATTHDGGGDFATRVGSLELHAAEILADASYVAVHVDGDVNRDGGIEIDPPVLSRINADLSALRSSDLANDFGLSASAEACVDTAATEAADALATQGSEWGALQQMTDEFRARLSELDV